MWQLVTLYPRVSTLLTVWIQCNLSGSRGLKVFGSLSFYAVRTPAYGAGLLSEIFLETSSWTHLEVCFHGDFKSSRVDYEE